jgi:hypothetical protein
VVSQTGGDDIWRASDPSTPATPVTLDELTRSGLVRAWWVSWIVWLIGDRAVTRMMLGGETVSDQLQASAALSAAADS